MGLEAKMERHVATSLWEKTGPLPLGDPSKQKRTNHSSCQTMQNKKGSSWANADWHGGKSEQHSLESVEPDDVVSTVARDMLQKDGRLAEMAQIENRLAKRNSNRYLTQVKLAYLVRLRMQSTLGSIAVSSCALCCARLDQSVKKAHLPGAPDMKIDVC